MVDPQYVKEQPELYKNISMDFISWKSIIKASLGKLYGIIGESIHLDILDMLKINIPAKVLVRIPREDNEKLVNSLMAFTFKLSAYGGEIDSACHVRVNKSADYLGLVLDNDF